MVNLSKNSMSILNLIAQKINKYQQIINFTDNFQNASAVIFLLSSSNKIKNEVDLNIILNKRSKKISQPGDLCCPGGNMLKKVDFLISKILYIPGTILTNWTYWSTWLKFRSNECKPFAVLLSTAIRESFEEMRFNILKLKLLGILPTQILVSSGKKIYPFVCWLPEEIKFSPNTEVDKIITIPISTLLSTKNYFKYKRRTNCNTTFPFFIYKRNTERELLWGVTLKITESFLKIVFNYNYDINQLSFISNVKK